MSCRWKKRKRRKKKKKRKHSGEAATHLVIETPEGTAFLAGPPKAPAWMSMGDYLVARQKGEAGNECQQSVCATTGDAYVRPITGRFKHLPEEKLKRMVDDLMQVFVRAGHSPVMDPGQPLWMQAEFLDNMLEFEIDPPCGCASELTDVIKSA
jgi:hypothetical protein